MVPRNELNLIHLGQISIMLFLNAHLGWDIKILIADLSDEKTNISEQYVKKIKQYFSRNGYACNDENFKYLSQLMKKDTASCCSITKDNFNEFFKKITFEKMEKYITKKNNPEKHKQQKVWKILRPFYTVAATTYLMNDLNKKCIIIAGNDECAMWNECSIDPEHKEKLGAILVPILSYNEDYQFSHDDENFYWQSTIIIKEEMDKSNIIDWVNNILIKPHDISFTKIIQNQDEELQKGALAEYIKNKLYEQR